MKLSYKILAATMAFAGLVACTPDEFEGADINNIPSIQQVKDDVKISVDQSTNTVTFLLDAKEVMPQWIFETEKATTYSTRNGLQKIYTIAGDYTVKVRVGNRNGWSDGTIEKSFHIDNSIFDFSKYENYLAGAAGNAEWRIDYAQKGHMGCGPSGTDGLEWWNADPSAKANEGVYDDRLTFTTDGKYNYNPGEGGTMYVNYGASIFPEFNTQKDKEIDFMASVEPKASSYTLSVEGTDLFLTLAPNSYFPYIPNDDFWANPRFLVLSMNSKSMELVTDNGGIAWHFILTSVKDVEVFKGFKYDSEFNMWRDAVIDDKEISFFYADASWAEYPEKPGMTRVGNKSFSFTMPNPTVDTWQNQVFIPTNIALSAAEKYDVSFVISSNVNVPKATAKLHKLGDDNTSLFAEVGSLNVKAGEDFVFYASDLAGIDAEATRFVFDFGGNAANAEITISNIVIKNHANDDGTVLPSEKPEEPLPNVTWDDAANLWATATFGEMTYYYAPGWAQIANPDFKAENGVYTISLPEATTDQWQGQVTFHTNIATSAEKTYDFMMKIISTQDHPGVTVKLTQEDNDDIFLTADRHAISADTETTIVLPALPGQDISALKFVLDFGGCAANTDITISEIRLQEHIGPKVVNWDFNSDKNLFKNANINERHFYYAPGWKEIAKPELAENNGSFSFSLPEATTDQWQAQFALKTDMSTSADKKYDYHVVLNSTTDIKGVTVKLVKDGEDGTFYCEDRIDLEADTDYEFVKTDMDGIDMPKVNFFFDFGGNPAGTEITVKDIIVYEAE